MFGAFAWREGQKLAAKLLGPPPKFPKMRDVPEDETGEKNSGTVTCNFRGIDPGLKVVDDHLETRGNSLGPSQSL